jgi:hypothetical protein
MTSLETPVAHKVLLVDDDKAVREVMPPGRQRKLSSFVSDSAQNSVALRTVLAYTVPVSYTFLRRASPGVGPLCKRCFAGGYHRCRFLLRQVPSIACCVTSLLRSRQPRPMQKVSRSTPNVMRRAWPDQRMTLKTPRDESDLAFRTQLPE